MNNLQIRIALIKNNVRQWEVAREKNMSEPAFSNLLRDELPEESQVEIISLIKEIAARKGEKANVEDR